MAAHDRTISLPVLTPRAAAPTPYPTLPPTEDIPKEKCGVVGVWNHRDAVHKVYMGLYAQQHRGQESAGIAVSDGSSIHGHNGMGLVSDVFNARDLADLGSYLARVGEELPDEQPTVGGAIGHNRYSTAGGSLACNVQPLIEAFLGQNKSQQVAVAHNGNLINADALRRRFAEAGHLFHTTSDTEVMIHLLAEPAQRDTPDPLAATLRRLQGAFSVVFLYPDRLEAARDPWAGARSCWVGCPTDATASRARRSRSMSWGPSLCARSSPARLSRSTTTA
jgi:amidophosphoribosyltransferase